LAKCAVTYSRDPIRPCFLAAPQPMRTVRRSLRPLCFRMRIASIITADPAALFRRAGAPCHESKCAPIMTTSSALSESRDFRDDVEGGGVVEERCS
jgi:hypothetical protein